MGSLHGLSRQIYLANRQPDSGKTGIPVLFHLRTQLYGITRDHEVTVLAMVEGARALAAGCHQQHNRPRFEQAVYSRQR